MPPEIRSTDIVGRQVRSSGQAKRLDGGQRVPQVFREKRLSPSLSVDRLDQTSDTEMTEIGDQIARGLGRSFYGWATLPAEQAERLGRTLRLEPILDNPYHASIDLNIPNNKDHWEEQQAHATDMASYASWRPRAPEFSSESI